MAHPDYHSFFYDAEDYKKIHAYVCNEADEQKIAVEILHKMAEHKPGMQTCRIFEQEWIYRLCQ